MFLKKEATLKIPNFNCSEPMFPSYPQIVIDGQAYPIKGEFETPPTFKSENPYTTYKVKVTGALVKETGHMPNPMVETTAFDLKEMEFTRT